MQITSTYPNVSINTANPATEQARRDMQRRELVEPVRDTEKGSAERALNSDDRTRNGNANSNVTLYDRNGKETETQQAVEGRQQQSSDQQSSEQQASEQKSSERQAAEQAEQQAQTEQNEVRELQARDQEVRAHEQAHATIGGRYAGSPSYDYQQGPDGRRYAVGGEVQIDLSPVPGDPQETIRKMQQVKAAALAPAEPSGADRSIAAAASQRAQQAQAELIAQNAEKLIEAAASSTANSETTASLNAATATDTPQQVESAPVAGIVLPQRERLEINPMMQTRTKVIQNFYQLATEPQQRPLRQQA
ncbi:putative metalloprotease CJM1_0395 family protein [Alishewanella sp. SMS8]|uniref:putative metalloprotease CJM1_0395 family protein n=1 Tax=Alishewanella sp. SMS8 TaxID=2994676 RepID=UPI002740E59E|nr:putative metalloprotease CJM1_0395 family protein [Alishewanella sp. SMS8]MDP4945613.1 hypothetical protein [Alishewanella sp.]MDP5205530.1 putative metalloprotease CJM1_0395 family protein [Alishewanella sp. SMS9]MDP5034972.1 hypothetical protein [Alishewanella sp.]MDP5186924.1 hypothetical protein [Alishewanella sp.]MDP5460546.1 putative metalloprotease CJM1_0395 family protein [Alishewanella sp. SMS8]